MTKVIIVALCLTGIATATINVATYYQLRHEVPKPTSRRIAELEAREKTVVTPNQPESTVSWEHVDPLLTAAFFQEQASSANGTRVATASTQSAPPRKLSKIPVLAGILRRADGDGLFHHSAILSGQLLEAGEEIEGFTVEKIDNTGVTLSRRGRKLFVEAPKINYTAWNAQ
jgi:hypothetical protein